MKDIQDKYFKKLYTSNSIIAGTGLFAGENIHMGEIILMFGGNLSIKEDRYSGQFLRSTCIGISENVLLGELADSKKDLSDFINHSCDPNAGLADAITLIAIKDILKDDEILSDYAFWESDANWAMKNDCLCGSMQCRKKITGQDWEKITSTDAKFKYFSPFLQRKIIKNETKEP